jgi:HSP20 family protein
MRSRIRAAGLPSEIGEFADEVQRIFRDLGRAFGETLTYAPAIDVYETDDALEVRADLPGVEAGSIRLVVKGQVLLIAGEKAPRRGRGESTFHLVERGYGRFARTVRLAVPCETATAQATLANGELRLTLRKIAERRGQPISIPLRMSSN